MANTKALLSILKLANQINDLLGSAANDTIDDDVTALIADIATLDAVVDNIVVVIGSPTSTDIATDLANVAAVAS